MLSIRINMYVFSFHYLFIELFIILMNCTTELSALHIFIVDIVCKEELENGQLYVKYWDPTEIWLTVCYSHFFINKY